MSLILLQTILSFNKQINSHNDKIIDYFIYEIISTKIH
jgi:hypothetical protein